MVSCPGLSAGPGAGSSSTSTVLACHLPPLECQAWCPSFSRPGDKLRPVSQIFPTSRRFYDANTPLHPANGLRSLCHARAITSPPWKERWRHATLASRAAGVPNKKLGGISAFSTRFLLGAMEAAAVFASSSLCSGAFWQRISGPQEERLLKLMSCALVGFVSLAVLFRLHRRGAPYGRYASASYGYPVPANLAWMVQEAPSFLFPVMLALCSDGARLSFWPNRFLLGLFLVHYFYRSFIFSVLIREGKSVPFFIFISAFIFCSYNGYLQGRSLTNYAEYSSNWLTEPCFILGIAAWLGGFVINVHSDNILRNLRKPGETGYKIPRGGMFEYVSGANFFGEIVEWCGFALACNTLESTAFAISTLLILGSRAYIHHQWYLNKFEDYPRSRKILIPFVF